MPGGIASIWSISLSYSGLLYREESDPPNGTFSPTGRPHLLCRSLSVSYGSERLPQWTPKLVSALPTS